MNTEHNIKSAGERKRKPEARVAPFFSWRSILILDLGLILGAVLGFGYYEARPYISPDTVLNWRSEVQIQVINLTTGYIDPSTIENRTKYYIVKTQSLPFLEFLSQKTGEEEPRYLHTANELAGMISLEYDTSTTNLVTNYKIAVTTTSAEETAFFIVRIPGIFIDYLVAEESNKQQQQYQDTLKAIETTKAALLDAQQELNAIAPDGIDSSLENNPTYVMLTAKIKALQAQLDKLTPGLADIIAQGTDTNDEFANSLVAAIEKTSAALVEAQKELAILEMQSTENSSSLSLDYKLAQDKVENLSKQLTSLNEKRDSLLVSSVDASTITDYLVIGNPSVPGPPSSLKLNTTILVGALIGIIIAWVVLNFRWFTKGASTSPEEED